MRGWVIYARVARGQALALSKYQFVESAQSIGAPAPWVLARHILPNLLPSIVTVAVLELARMVLAESSLSFLGLGVQPPGISWGLMLAEGRSLGSLKATGLRPKFLEKMAFANVVVDPRVFVPEQL